jgi:predicted ATPase/DNA-binding SARP family transcriptional activator/class 3 adenylate cyclase
LIVNYRILGPFEVTRGGEKLAVGGPRQQAVLVALLMHANEVVATDQLIEMVWGDSAPAKAANTLHGYVFHLRRALEPTRGQGKPAEILVSEPNGYRLHARPDEIDAAQFERLADHGRRLLEAGDSRAAELTLTEALGLWRSDPLPGFEDHEFATTEISRLRERRTQAAEDHLAALLNTGEHDAVIAAAETLCTQHPWRERLWGLRMTALYRVGRQADALAAFQTVRATLIDELGVEPGPDLRALEQRILAQDVELDLSPTTGAKAAPPDSPPHGLPHPVSSFIGREDDISRVADAVGQARLVTILGPGGVGKTRLAIAAGHHLAATFDDTFFADLSTIADPALTANVVAATLGVDDTPDRPAPESIISRLTAHKILLVLDNCEHLIDATARLTAELLSSCATLTIVATSREAIGIDGEHIVALAPMSTPPIGWHGPLADPEDFTSIRLFCDRAHAVLRDFDPETGWDHIATVCRAVDGVPLALELAAARLRSMPLDVVAGRIEDRFRLLTGGSRAAVSRQRTLEAAMDWSYDLLEPAERFCLARASVFVGGFTTQAAEFVLGCDPIDTYDVVDLIGQLVDKSLLSLEPGTGRYRSLETIRHYASTKLDPIDAEQCRHRHALWSADFASRHAPGMRSGGNRGTIAALDAEAANLRSALNWALESDEGDLAVSLSADLGAWWEIRGHLSEGRDKLERSLETGAGTALHRYRCILAVGFIARRQGDHLEALRHTETAVAGLRQLGEDAELAHALGRMAWVTLGAGDHVTAEKLAHEGLEIATQLNDPAIPPWMHLGLGHAAYQRGDLNAAADLLAQARQGFHDIDNRPGLGRALFHQAQLALELADTDTAADAAAESVRLMHAGHDINGTLMSIEVAAQVAGATNNVHLALRLLAATAAIRDELGAHDHGSGLSGIDDLHRRCEAALGTTETENQTTLGRQLTLEEAVDQAIESCRSAPAPSQHTEATRAFMFTDMVDSTSIQTALGDHRWMTLLDAHDNTLRKAIADRGGDVIKQQGDGFFVVFKTADDAAQAACDIQQSLRNQRVDAGFAPDIRIGIHHGTAVSRDGDWIGTDVTLAARVTDAAKAGEILCTEPALPSTPQAQTSETRCITIKGRDDTVTVHVIHAGP